MTLKFIIIIKVDFGTTVSLWWRMFPQSPWDFRKNLLRTSNGMFANPPTDVAALCGRPLTLYSSDNGVPLHINLENRTIAEFVDNNTIRFVVDKIQPILRESKHKEPFE